MLDVATGNGQAARLLAAYAGRVVAVDASGKQLRHAAPHPRVHFARARSEDLPFGDGSIDLVTVAQAIHWFDFAAFFSACERVCSPGGVVAAWTYHLLRIVPEVDVVVDGLYHGPVGKHWPPERRHIEAHYDTVPFPLDRIVSPDFQMESEWDVDQLMGYLRTWSSVRGYLREYGTDPVAAVEEELRTAYGPGRRVVRWPFILKVGRIGTSI